jgi:hypothetical protein
MAIDFKDLFEKTLNSSFEPADQPDQYTKDETSDLEMQHVLEQRLLETQTKRQALKQHKSEHKQRVQYAEKIYKIVRNWLIIVVIIVSCSAIPSINFQLSDNVLITLLTTSTATVLGLFITVLKYIFGRSE